MLCVALNLYLGTSKLQIANTVQKATILNMVDVTHKTLLTERRISLMKQQFVVTRRYTNLQETENPYRSSTDQHLSVLCFYEDTKSNFLGGTQNFDKVRL